MKLDDFLPHVLVELPGCSDPLVKQTLVRVAVEFCQRTLAWDEIQDPIALLDGVSEYEICVPSGGQVYQVRDVWIRNRRLRPITLQDLQLEMPDWRESCASEPSSYNLALARGTLSVFPKLLNVPSGTAMVLRVAYVPSNSATVLPDFLGQQYLNAIAAGVKSRLMAMPNQAWTQPALVSFYWQQFEEGVFNARAEALHDRTFGTVSVTPRRYGF